MKRRLVNYSNYLYEGIRTPTWPSLVRQHPLVHSKAVDGLGRNQNLWISVQSIVDLVADGVRQPDYET